MKRKRGDRSAVQLSLFDAGLEKPVLAPAERKVIPSAASSPVVRPATEEHITGARAQFYRPDPPGPSPFETASYELYLKLKAEVFGLAKMTGLLATLLLGIVFLGVQIPEAGLGVFKVGSIKHDILVGLVGWLTILSAGFTLIRASFLMRKKIQCGVFYQRVLEFSDSPAIQFFHRFFNILFVVMFAGIIALTLVVAWVEMRGLVVFIVHGLLSLQDPWRATVIPSPP